MRCIRRWWGFVGLITASALLHCVGSDPADNDGKDTTSNEAGTDDSGGAQSEGGGDDASEGDAGADGSLPALTIAPSVAVAYGFSCALRASGKVYCWGWNAQGQLGNGPDASTPTPVLIPSLTDAARIGLGNGFACALRTNHTVSCWGSNGLGSAGQPFATSIVVAPTAVAGMTDVMDIAVGGGHVCARKSDKSVWCWGSNGSDQLAHANTTDIACVSSVPCNPTPTKVASLSADAIAAGIGHTCALVGTKAFCWGANSHSQLGHLAGTNMDVGAGNDLMNPTPVEASATGVKAIFAGGDSTCMLNGSGAASCWGDGEKGQLGDLAATPASSDPIAITGLPAPVLKIAPGWMNNCAVQNSSAWCWGTTSDGQEGIDAGNGSGFAGATRVVGWLAGQSSVVDVASTHPGAHHCALTNDGSVYCWGFNVFTELGHDVGIDQTCQSGKCNAVPTKVLGLP